MSALEATITAACEALTAALRSARTQQEIDAAVRQAGRLFGPEHRDLVVERRHALAIAELAAPLAIPRGALLRDETRDAVPAAATAAWPG